MNIGVVGLVLCGVSALMVLGTAGLDTYHDYLMRQVELITLKEMDLARKVRRAMEADKLRTLEAMQFEQSMQMADLELLQKETDEPNGLDIYQPLPPGAVQ